MKYENLIKILLSQFWGNETRNQKCQKLVSEYIDKIEQIVEEGIEKKEIIAGDPKIIASEIYGLIATSLAYKLRTGKEIKIMDLYKEFENTIIKGLKIN